MRRILPILFVLLAWLGCTETQAQSRSSYFMEGTYFRTDLNPALTPDRGYVALPFISGVGYTNSSNSTAMLTGFRLIDGKYVHGMDSSVSAADYLAALPKTGRTEINYTAKLFGMGFYTGNVFWNFGVNGNLVGDMSIDKSLIRYLKSPETEQCAGEVQAKGSAYMDIYVGSSFPLMENVNVGFRAKVLVGFADMSLDVEPTVAAAGASIADMLHAQWGLNAGIIDNKRSKGEGYVNDDINRDNLMGVIGSANSAGFAVDFGADVRLCNDHLRLSLAVTDLGFIRWNPSSHLTGGIAMDGSGRDDIEFLTVPADPGYTRRLNCALNFGAEYSFLNNRVSFGLLSHTKFCSTMEYSELTASFNLRPFDWMSATLSHTFLNGNRAGIFGAALNFYPKFINIFIGVDFLDPDYSFNFNMPNLGDECTMMRPPMIMASRANSVNFYAGLGFNFGQKKSEREIPDDYDGFELFEDEETEGSDKL